jgi:hypothetical protein
MTALSKTLKISLVLLVFLSACNLVKSTPAPVEVDRGSSVRILQPAAGALLPADAPVEVSFSAEGGPFIEFNLSVNGVLVATQAASSTEAQISGSIVWPAPSSGFHLLTLAALDVKKNEIRAEVQIQIGSEGASAGITPTDDSLPSNGFQIRFLDFADGGTVSAAPGVDGKPVVIVRVQVTGQPPAVVTMTANGMYVPGDLRDPSGMMPFTGEFQWSPLNGGGQYTLVAQAASEDKQFVEVSANVTVTGMPVFTATPPPLNQPDAQARFHELYQQLYGIDIPAPSIQRFDFAQYPNYSRWISSIYYQGQRYYLELFDDTHYELGPFLPYAGAVGHPEDGNYRYCRPAGEYRILVVFVDYGNLTIDKNDALAQVPIFGDWTNQLYSDFAYSQGFDSSPLHISAEAAWIATPPAPGDIFTKVQIAAASGADPSNYDLVIQIDLDKNNTAGIKNFSGILDQGGGVALQGCGGFEKTGEVNIWSVVTSTQDSQTEVHGSLSMDFNHELSHLFGMLDNWPFKPSAITSPDGAMHDDWIPYTTFGWTDTDGDGIPEIIDPTPYGTTGPQP